MTSPAGGGLLASGRVFASLNPSNATASILGANISPRQAAAAFRLSVLMSTSATFSMGASNSGTAVVGALNAGVALAAGAWYTFTVGCRANEAYYFRQGNAGGNRATLYVEEVQGGEL